MLGAGMDARPWRLRLPDAVRSLHPQLLLACMLPNHSWRQGGRNLAASCHPQVHMNHFMEAWADLNVDSLSKMLSCVMLCRLSMMPNAAADQSDAQAFSE